jgi:anti-sigma regulatory factor (Ser/Thr protein kinase)
MERRRGDWLLAPEDRSVPRARGLVRDTLRELPTDALEVVLLLTSELVTNAIRHGAGQVGLHVTWDGGGVQVEVADRSSDLPVVRPLERGSPGGRGLVLIDALSSSWGVLADDTGKTVWFRLEE